MLQDNFDGYWLVIKYRIIIVMFTIDENRVSDAKMATHAGHGHWEELTSGTLDHLRTITNVTYIT